MPERFIKSEPYAWPYNGDLRPENTALIVLSLIHISEPTRPY